MNILSKTSYSLSEDLQALQAKKEFVYTVIGVCFASIFLHIFGNSYLKIADISVIAFLAMLWLVKWGGKSNREVIYYVGIWLVGVGLLALLSLTNFKA